MTASLQLSPGPRAHLTPDALGRLRDKLVSELAAQQAQCARHSAAAVDLRDLTDSDSILERELADAGAVRAREAIADIEHALRRLAGGTYGSCEACGAELPRERLEAVPAARTCVSCPGRGRGLLR